MTAKEQELWRKPMGADGFFSHLPKKPRLYIAAHDVGEVLSLYKGQR
jgi:hypothetical protein